MKFGFGSPSDKNGVPRIDRIAPSAAIPGGEIAVYGYGFASRTGARPIVHFGDAEASLMLATDNRVIARVPDNASTGGVRVANAQSESQPHPVSIGLQIADNLHPVANPSGLALDHNGNLFVSCRNDGTVHRITPDGRAEQWVEGMGIATGIAFD